MIEFKQGALRNMEGECKDIVVKAKSANSGKERFIGLFLVMLGINYLTRSAFKNGSEAFENAEVKTMKDLNIIK